ncbi:MAG: DUF4242 domain-containing protein [Chloroflexota bacterium]
MSLFLAEYAVDPQDRAVIEALGNDVAARAKQVGGELIEVQVGTETKRAYIVLEHASQDVIASALTDSAKPEAELAEVRLVGADLANVKAARAGANFLVEWDLPSGLAMDAYLARKKANSPKYAEVPQVKFLRTYVREDMMKCLCFYDAPAEEDVRAARQAVGAPIDRLTHVSGAADGSA